jgi:hypothetical protein
LHSERLVASDEPKRNICTLPNHRARTGTPSVASARRREISSNPFDFNGFERWRSISQQVTRLASCVPLVSCEATTIAIVWHATKVESGGDDMAENLQARTAGSVTEDCIAERHLWTAVLVMAVEDWRKGTLRARREAQKFLFEDHSDFDQVCARAGVDPSGFRAGLLRIGKKIAMEGAWAYTMAA